MGTPSPKYTAEFKQKAVELYRKSGTTYAEVARGLGCDPGSLSDWVKKAAAEAGEFDGEQGPQGEPGRTPVRGVDYWTEEDRAPIEAATEAAEQAAAEAVGNRLTGEVSGAVAHVDDAFSAKALGLAVYGNSKQDGTPSPDAPKPIASVTQAAVVACGKNLVRNVYGKALVSNGVAFTPLADGGIRAEGTSAGGGAYYNFDFATGVRHLRGRTITMNGTGGGAAYWSFDVFNEDGTHSHLGTSHGTGATFEVPEGAERCRCFVAVPDGATANETVYPMACIGAKATVYESYVSASVTLDLQGHELRGLPDGYRDEARFDADGGTLISRIGKAESLTIRANQFAVSSKGKPFMTVPFEVFPTPSTPSNATVCDAFPYSTALNGDVERGCYRTWNAIIFFNAAWKDGEQAARELTELNPTVLCAVPEKTTPLGKVDMPTLPAPWRTYGRKPTCRPSAPWSTSATWASSSGSWKSSLRR